LRALIAKREDHRLASDLIRLFPARSLLPDGEVAPRFGSLILFPGADAAPHCDFQG
jgi:hypothetical protein